MTTLHLRLDRVGGSPLHRQIHEGIRRAILDRVLRPGQRLPSTRALAADLAVSRQPVLAAYEQLLHEGYLEGRHGSGTYVSRALPDDLLMPPRNPAPPAHPAANDGATVWNEGGTGPFRMSQPALDRFPRALWARLVARHARALPPERMAYGDPAGTHELRAAVAAHLVAARAVNCEPEQVLIVPGSQAALRIAAAALLEPGDRVALEEPGYPGARSAFAAACARLVPVPVDAEGLDVRALARSRARIRAVCVTPSHQYPLGVTMSAARRLELLDWAERRDAWLLEDDYDSEYRYVSRPLGALQGMDAHGRVLYIGTFSKVMFPALRIGYVVVPRGLEERFLRARLALDLFSPVLYQLALAEFLREGHFVRHLRRMRSLYVARRDALLAGLGTSCGEYLEVINADAGLHVAAALARPLEDTEVVRSMAARGLAATALSTCYATTKRQSGLLLGFGGSDEAELLRSTRLLSAILRALTRA